MDSHPLTFCRTDGRFEYGKIFVVDMRDIRTESISITATRKIEKARRAFLGKYFCVLVSDSENAREPKKQTCVKIKNLTS